MLSRHLYFNLGIATISYFKLVLKIFSSKLFLPLTSLFIKLNFFNSKTVLNLPYTKVALKK